MTTSNAKTRLEGIIQQLQPNTQKSANQWFDEMLRAFEKGQAPDQAFNCEYCTSAKATCGCWPKKEVLRQIYAVRDRAG